MRDVPFAVAALVSFLCIAGLDALPATAAEKTTAVAATSERTQVFVIEKMNCALCPVTVKTAMARVAGVKSVQVKFDTKTASVVYDPSVATTRAIAAASTNAGYPATPVVQGK